MSDISPWFTPDEQAALVIAMGTLIGACVRLNTQLPITKEHYVSILGKLGVDNPEQYWYAGGDHKPLNSM